MQNQIRSPKVRSLGRSCADPLFQLSPTRPAEFLTIEETRVTPKA